ncbi:MAG: alpha/beta hydrolase domain-containing protein [Chloroflexota bacterium]
MSVADFELTRRLSYANGRAFGDTGPYEQLDGILTFAVDPDHEANRLITDLHLAPRDSGGLVRFTADLSVIRPTHSERGSRDLLVELPNRGRRRVVDTLNYSGADAAASPAPGDGFLFNRGLTVASVGWQWDVYRDDVLMGLDPPMADLSGEPDPGRNVVEIRPNQRHRTHLLADRVHRPLKVQDTRDPEAALYVREFEDGPESLVPRDRWRFARETPDGVVPSNEHIYLEDGFEPGKYYQVVYTAGEAPVAGAGLLALRDAAAFLRRDCGQLVHGLGEFDRAFGYGVSQTGRMLRHFLYLGLNVDEGGRRVFDGLLPHVAGARRGAFNHRYAQPSNQSYPNFGHLFPFADRELDDPLSGKTEGLMSRLNASGMAPRVIYTNTSAEYWRGDCSLMHTDAERGADISQDPNTRIYHFAGTQHGAGSLPQTREGAAEGAVGRYGYNVVDYTPLLRAALVHLVRWVTDGVEPPPSRHPRVGDGTAVPRDTVLKTFSRLPGQVVPDAAKLWVIRTIDLGPRAQEGVGVYPTVEGQTYPCLVSAVDEDGNEVAGIRLPDLTQPVATHAGWNVRSPETGAPDQQIPMQGFSRWMPTTSDRRRQSGDPRRSIDERYADRTEYEWAVQRDAEILAADDYILAEDVELVVRNAMDRYDYALAFGTAIESRYESGATANQPG